VATLEKRKEKFMSKCIHQLIKLHNESTPKEDVKKIQEQFKLTKSMNATDTSHTLPNNTPASSEMQHLMLEYYLVACAMYPWHS